MIYRWFLLFIVWFLTSIGYCEYEIVWSTIDGGGGQCSGGPYTLVGTVGQPDAGLSSGGDFVLNGGYWAGTCGCVVNLTDLSIFLQQWLFIGPDLKADLWSDGAVNLEDFAELAYWWMSVCPPDWPLK